MRIMTLAELLASFRSEARLSQNVAHGTHAIIPHTQLLRRVQEDLYAVWHWPHLQTETVVDIPGGVRFVEYPDVGNVTTNDQPRVGFSSIEKAWAADASGKYREITYGISVDQYNAKAEGELGFPVCRWKNYMPPAASSLTQNMFEVWPVPDRATKVRFAGKRTLFPLNEDGDRTTLDGPLIAMYAAAEVLAAQKAEDAGLKLEKAKARFNAIKAQHTQGKTERINLSGGPRRGGYA
jgi:hypothetical protein